MADSLRQLKPHVPRPLWVLGRRARNYLKRLNALWNVARNIKGVSVRDKAVVGCSLVVAPFRLMRSLDCWRDPELIHDATVRSRNLGTFQIRGNTDDLIHVLPTHDPVVYATVERILREGDTFIDGGANMGSLSVLAAKIVGETGAVLAVEMHPETFASLEKNIALNGLTNVTLINKALSSSCSECIAANVGPGRFGQASVSDDSPARFEKGAESFDVETVTLDQAARDVADVALIKLDLEGHEVAALQGAEELLTRTENIIFEHWGSRTAKEAEFLEAQGFVCKHLNGRNVLATRKDQLDTA